MHPRQHLPCPSARHRGPTGDGRSALARGPASFAGVGALSILLVVGLLVALGGCLETPSPSHRAQSERPADDPSESPDEPETHRGTTPPFRAHSLETIFHKLDRIASDKTRERATILHVGDSHTASDTITGRIRELFQDQFGSAGRGYTYPGKPWHTFRQEQTTYAMSDEWTSQLGIVDDPAPPFAAGGLRVETSAEGAWLERGSCGIEDDEEDDEKTCRYGREFDSYAITYLIQEDGGSFGVSVDGSTSTVVETDGPETAVGVVERSIEPGPHKIRIETEGDGPVALFGIRTRLGDNGVEYHSLGLNGATAGDFAGFDPQLTRQEIQFLAPDLLIVAFGTNEAYNFHRMLQKDAYSLSDVTEAMADYQTTFRRLLDRYRTAAPRASCLVMLPPDTAPQRDDVPCRDEIQVGGDEVCIPPTIRNWSAVVATQRAAARRAGCAIWDQSRAMGGEGSIRWWAAVSPPLARSDGIHLTMDGYHLLAEAFVSDLMRTYESWKRGGQLPLETRPIGDPEEVEGLDMDSF